MPFFHISLVAPIISSPGFCQPLTLHRSLTLSGNVEVQRVFIRFAVLDNSFEVSATSESVILLPINLKSAVAIACVRQGTCPCCNTADTPNAPNSAPGCPSSAPPGRAPNTTKTCPEELMPAEAPEFHDRSRRPGARGERGPVRGGLPQEDTADQRCDMVYHVDARVHDDGAAKREECRERGARDGVEVGIEERVAWKGEDRGTGALHDVEGDVVDGQLEQQLEDHSGVEYDIWDGQRSFDGSVLALCERLRQTDREVQADRTHPSLPQHKWEQREPDDEGMREDDEDCHRITGCVEGKEGRRL
ncbi:hypothetical protein H4582DRAFT_2053803 [Lactarius indigo]|nr:hypothetical protein H4582DRAFT_2053803 [Lactarius indigo]